MLITLGITAMCPFMCINFLEISFAEMPQSEPYEVIGWRDPSETTAANNTAVNQPPEVVRIFSLSTPSADESQLIELIEQLGGQISDNTKFDSKCTHLVAERPTRSERALSSISAGKWFMCPEYIHKSVEHGSFLNVSVNLKMFVCTFDGMMVANQFHCLFLVCVYVPRKNHLNGAIRQR